jgi:CheY-like chemotaxis protein
MLPPCHPVPIIVAIDDSEDDLFFFERALRKAHVEFPLVRFTSAIDAAKYLVDAATNPSPQRVPCVIFTDIHMPEMNGFEFITWVRSRKELSGLPIVVLSTSDDSRDVARGRQVGADRHFVKFPDSARIVQVLDQAVLSQRSQ